MNTDFYIWSRLLVYLYDHQNEDITQLQICKNMNIATVSSISIIIQMLARKGLMKFELHKRNNRYKLTDKGQKVAEYLQKIFTILR